MNYPSMRAPFCAIFFLAHTSVSLYTNGQDKRIEHRNKRTCTSFYCYV